MKVTTMIGPMKFEMEVKSVKEVFENLSFWANEWSQICGSCDSNKVLPFSRKNKDGNVYYTGKCQDCGHEYAYGQNKNGVDLFHKGPWGEPYAPPASDQQAEEILQGKTEAKPAPKNLVRVPADGIPPEYGGR